MAAFPDLRDDLGVMEGYHSPQLDVEVRLNTNESPYPPPRAFLAELAEAVATTSYHRYPDRQAWALREDLARWHGVRPEQLFVANGSNEVLQCLLLAYGGAGRTAAVFEPTYAMHGTIARMAGTAVAVGARGPDFTIDPADVRRVVEDAAPTVTFLCSPNNPTGTAESKDVLDQVLELAPGLVLVDEAYGQFASWSALDLVDDDLPLVVTRTYSKTWSMAGARLGYLVGPVQVVEALWEKAALPYHLDALKQAAGRLALRHVDDMETRVAALVHERERIQQAFASMDVDTWPSEANFVLFRPRSAPGRTVWERLVERSVLVRDCSSWPRLEDCLRVTVGTEEEDGRFLAALEESL
jgi:histidinol-phosphate aminotransferase